MITLTFDHLKNTMDFLHIMHFNVKKNSILSSPNTFSHPKHSFKIFITCFSLLLTQNTNKDNLEQEIWEEAQME